MKVPPRRAGNAAASTLLLAHRAGGTPITRFLGDCHTHPGAMAGAKLSLRLAAGWVAAGRRPQALVGRPVAFKTPNCG